MLRKGLEQEILQHFPNEITARMDLPFFRMVDDVKIENGRDIGGVINHPINSVTVFTHSSSSQGKPFRSVPKMKANGIHEIIHYFHNQQRYSIKGFQRIANRINRSYDRRSNLSKQFGERSLTYSDPGPFENEFVYKPELSGLQRSLSLTLVEDEVSEIFSEYHQKLEEDEFSGDELRRMEEELDQDINEVLDSISDDRIKEYMRPIEEMHKVTDFENSNGFRVRDEALARFYVTATLPEYTQLVIENSPYDVDISDGLSHDNLDFTAFFVKNVETGYGEECASEVYQLTESYRALRKQGHGRKEAADKILIDFLNDVETISY